MLLSFLFFSLSPMNIFIENRKMSLLPFSFLSLSKKEGEKESTKCVKNVIFSETKIWIFFPDMQEKRWYKGKVPKMIFWDSS